MSVDRAELKRLFEARERIDKQITEMMRESERQLEQALEPLRKQFDALDDQMNVVLGDEWCWIEGRFDADSLPAIERA